MSSRAFHGLRRADVLTVLVLGVFLLAVAGSSTSKPQEQARRALCRANLGKIGRAMVVYAGDYDGALPRAGGPGSEWGPLGINWMARDRYTAYGITPGTNKGGRASIGSCFYLLVKYVELPTKRFICPGDGGTRPFKLGDEDVPKDFALIDAWEFGVDPITKYSYAYHFPFGGCGLTKSRDPNLPVAADRTPWMKGPATDVVAEDWTRFQPDIPPYSGTAENARLGNAIPHKKRGQNVLFLDGRVTFERRAFCGLDGDNIYTRSSKRGKGDPRGKRPAPSTRLKPNSERDSLLVNDPDSYVSSGG